MRPTPQKGESGGSSGWRAILTPSLSAIGSIASRKYERFLSKSPSDICLSF